MKPLKWNLGKNLKLKLERGVGFEMVADAVERNAFEFAKVKSKNHPGQNVSSSDFIGNYGWSHSKRERIPFSFSQYTR